MKPFLRNTLIFGTLAVVLGSLYIKDKINTAIDVFDKITIKPFSLPKSIKFSEPNWLGIPQRIDLMMDIVINNPDYQDLSVSGFGVATLKSVDVFFKNALIGSANLMLDEIEVPAQSSYVIKNVPFTGRTLSILSNAEAFANANINDFRFVSKLELAGIEYEI